MNAALPSFVLYIPVIAVGFIPRLGHICQLSEVERCSKASIVDQPDGSERTQIGAGRLFWAS